MCLKKSFEDPTTPAVGNYVAGGVSGVGAARLRDRVFASLPVYRYLDQPRDDRAVRQRLKEIAETRVRYGFARIHILLRREGWRDNHKRTYRIYKEEGLNLRSKRPRRNKTRHIVSSGRC